MTDALEMFRAMRPSAPTADQDIREPASRGSADLHNLAMVPGSAAYRARIPKPPCFRCGEDHHPGLDYGHEWEAEPVHAIHDEPVSATAISRRPTELRVDVSEPSVARRVALYVGRNDTYVVAIEEAPDWDSVHSFKVDAEMVLPLISMARALGAKIADKTGGDLVMLEQEATDVSQHAQAHAGGAAGAGSAEPRRQGPAAAGPQEGEPVPATTADGGDAGGSGERGRAARRAQR
jgi:hypothetical protein